MSINPRWRELARAMFGQGRSLYADYRLPEHITPDMLRETWQRNGLARAAVNRIVGKTWQSNPWLLERQRDDGEAADETPLEKDIRKQFERIRFWQALNSADERALVSGWSALVLRFGDGRAFSEPVERVPGGIAGLVGVLPVWRTQLKVTDWDSVQTSPTYGEPLFYQFEENVPGTSGSRSIKIHPSRVLIWAEDGTMASESALMPGYNDIMTMEKIIGAGGEGFWRNAKSMPVIEMDKEVDLQAIASQQGVSPADLSDRLSKEVGDWTDGFSKALIMQGMSASTLQVSLPAPEQFFNIALQSFAASIPIPQKILVGSQTGERASTEDANEWAQTIMARRSNWVIPLINGLTERLVDVGILPPRDWFVDWDDLTEASPGEKIDRANKMADVNVKTAGTGELVFLPEEIRSVAGYEPLDEAEKQLASPGSSDDNMEALGEQGLVDGRS